MILVLFKNINILVFIFKLYIYMFIYLLFIYLINYKIICNIKWGLGIGDWGLGIGDWAQSPIPNPHILIFIKFILNKY